MLRLEGYRSHSDDLIQPNDCETTEMTETRLGSRHPADLESWTGMIDQDNDTENVRRYQIIFLFFSSPYSNHFLSLFFFFFSFLSFCHWYAVLMHLSPVVFSCSAGWQSRSVGAQVAHRLRTGCTQGPLKLCVIRCSMRETRKCYYVRSWSAVH